MPLSDFSRDVLAYIDAGSGALGRGDRHLAAAQYARACELLFREARIARDSQRKLELARRGQQLLQSVRHLRDEVVSDVQSIDRTQSVGGTQSVSGTDVTVHRREAGATDGPRIKTGITFADVAGLDSVKETLHLRLIYPLLHPDKLAQYGLRSGGGLLLFGPPGTGKTMIAKAVAGELDMPFFAIKPSEVLSKFYGESEQKLAALFDEARSFDRGAIVFVDEVDSIGTSRSEEGANPASRRLLTQLLQELDGVHGRDSGLLFLAATNEPWLLDDALLRPGRFDEKCYVPLPDEPARRVLLALQLRNVWMAADLDLDAIAMRSNHYSGADLMCLCERAKQIPFREAVLHGTERPLAQTDLEHALHNVRPSVAPELLRRFEEYNS